MGLPTGMEPADAEQSRGAEGKHTGAEAEKRPHLRLIQCRARRKSSGGEKECDGESDARDDAEHGDVPPRDPRRRVQTGEHTESRGEDDAHRLARKYRNKDDPCSTLFPYTTLFRSDRKSVV